MKFISYTGSWVWIRYFFSPKKYGERYKFHGLEPQIEVFTIYPPKRESHLAIHWQLPPPRCTLRIDPCLCFKGKPNGLSSVASPKPKRKSVLVLDRRRLAKIPCSTKKRNHMNSFYISRGVIQFIECHSSLISINGGDLLSTTIRRREDYSSNIASSWFELPSLYATVKWLLIYPVSES